MAWMPGYILGVLHLLFSPVLWGELQPSLQQLAPAFTALFIAILMWRAPAPQFRFAIGVLIGVVHAQWQAGNAIEARLPLALDSRLFEVVGHIESVSCVANATDVNETGQHGWPQSTQRCRLILSVKTVSPITTSIDTAKTYSPRLRRVRLSYYGEETLVRGERISARVKLKTPRSFANPASFDIEKHSLARGVDASGYIRQLTVHTQPAIDSGAGKQVFIFWLRDRQVYRLQALVDGLANDGLVSALLLGDRSGLSSDQKQLLEATGTIHLLAISGLHIGVAAGVGLLLANGLIRAFPQLCLYAPKTVWQASLAIPVAAYYAVIAGLSVPTQRALLMLASLLLSRSLRRNFNSWQHLLIAMLAVTLLDPLAVLDGGFWYSFGAVAALMLGFTLSSRQASGSRQNRPVLSRWPLPFIVGLLQTQWILLLAMPVVLLASSNWMPLLAPLANLLAIPLVTLLVVPTGIAAMVASNFQLETASLLLALMDGGLSLLTSGLRLLEPMGNWRMGAQFHHPGVFQLSVLVLAAAVVIRGRMQPMFLPALGLWLLAMLWPFEAGQRRIAPGQLVLTQLDVGQGSALLISTHAQHWLYDTGPAFGQGFDAGRSIVLPFLLSQGIRKLDAVIVSHGDSDHSGGAASLAAEIEVGQWWLGGSATRPETYESNVQPASRQCLSGRRRIVDEWQFLFLHPAGLSSSDSENNRSCVLQLRPDRQADKGAGVVIAGDISSSIEYRLIAKSPENTLASQLLVVAHHGSNSSSSAGWIRVVQPRIALVSAGFNNRYRHPHDAVLQRYQRAGVELYRSDELGAIQYWYQNGQWLGPYCQRYRRRHFWQHPTPTGACIGPLRNI